MPAREPRIGRTMAAHTHGLRKFPRISAESPQDSVITLEFAIRQMNPAPRGSDFRVA